MFDKVILYLTVSLTGAAVMIIELLGTRIIGPFYGVSLYVWSSLISVTLFALAVGYFLGGIIADKNTRFRLSHVISLAALFVAVIPLISDVVLSGTDSLGIRAGAFSSSVILFTIPLTLLAMVGPMVIALAADRLNIIGSVSGSVYAVSTIGSVLGTLFLGFYLLPEFGSKTIIDALSVSLIILSISWAIFEARSGKIFAWGNLPVGVVTVIFLTLSHSFHNSDEDPGFTQVFAEESIYGWVRVIDEPEKNIRWLMSDASTIGAASLSTGQGLLQYQKSIEMLPDFHPDGKNVLLIGLGSGHLATHFDKLGLITDTIEIDASVATAAKKFFNFNPKGDLILGDARYHVRQLKKKYDFIIHDCFTGGTDPSHLLTSQMFQTLQNRLKPGGILVVNLVGFMHGDESNGTKAIARTLSKTFKYSKTFIADLNKNFNDITFFVSNSPIQIKSKRKNNHIENWLKSHEFNFPETNGFILTDNYNPLDSLQVKKAELYRKQMVDRVGKKILLW